MIPDIDKITVRQLQSLLILYMFGVAAVCLPGIAAEYAGTDGWVSVALAALAAAIGVYLIGSLAVLHRGVGFHDVVCRVLSWPIGKLICLLLIFRALVGLGLELRIFGEIIREFLLPLTPIWLVLSVMLLLGGFAIWTGLATRARAAEILTFIVLVPLILMLIFAALRVDYTNLLPVLRGGTDGVFTGGMESGFVFAPIINVLVLVFLVGGFDSRGRRRTVKATALAGVLLTAVTAITIARFSAGGTAAHTWPFLEMLFTVEIPGAFMERHNALVISFWILTVFIGTGAGLFVGAHLLRDTINKGPRNAYLVALLPITLVLAILPDGAEHALTLARALYRATGPALALLLPWLLLVITRIRQSGSKILHADHVRHI